MTVRIGMIAPFDEVHDQEFWDYLPRAASLHFTRTPYRAGPVDEALARVVSEPAVLTEAARSLAKIDPAVVGFASTAGTYLRGFAAEADLRAAIRAGGVRDAVTTSGALVEALRRLNIRKVAIATPYTNELAAYLPPFLESGGVGKMAMKASAASAVEH